MEDKKTLSRDYFEKVYAASDDPWNFETSEYEAQKYAATLAALSRPHYDKALEIGCSIGVLTERMAVKCGHLTAVDISEKALQCAGKRCADLENITFKSWNFPDELPEEQYDLILISEVAYYLSADDWEAAVPKIFDMLHPEGETVLVHWLPKVPEHTQTGGEVHFSFAKILGDRMDHVFGTATKEYRIDVWKKF